MRWLKGVNLFFLSILAVLAILLICHVAFGSWEQRIRYAGLLLELMGVGTVAIGLHETRKLFGKPGLREVFLKLMKAFPPLKMKPIVARGDMRGIELTMKGYGRTKYSPPWKESLEERIAILENGLDQTNECLLNVTKRLDEETERLNTKVESESKERSSEDEKNRKLIEEAAAGGLYIEGIGVFWLALGVILSHASHEIANIFFR